jgi:DNA-binding IclR family transcriptional regulator
MVTDELLSLTLPPMTLSRPVAGGGPSDFGSRSSGRWVQLLGAFLEEDEWGVRDLAEATGIPKSAVHRLLRNMEHEGVLVRAATSGRYRVGPFLIRMALVLSRRVDVIRIARPVLERIARSTGETAILALHVPSRNLFRAVDAAESDHAISYIPQNVGQWGDLHVGASGKAILAFLPEAEREAILATLPEQLADLRISKAELREQLRSVRENGYFVSHGERSPGVVGTAAPIFDDSGRVFGDVIITWPEYRNSPEREKAMVHAAVGAASDISSGLGYQQGRRGRG